MELTIKKTPTGVMVYDENSKDRIDLFPDTKEGKDNFFEFMYNLGCDNPQEYWE